MKLPYHNNHPRQIQLCQSVVKNLIIELGLRLSIVERDPHIKFMNVIDPKFTMTGGRTLSLAAIPRLCNTINIELEKFCNRSNLASLTIDV